MEQKQNVDTAVGLKQIGVTLHDLCQPLTTLQCRLEMARILDTDADYREAVTFGLAECARLADCVATMREALRSLLSEESGLSIE
ncbi:MAG: hypothetical protein NVS9B15_19980 [Acidobacteriaceae bacterium]